MWSFLLRRNIKTSFWFEDQKISKKHMGWAMYSKATRTMKQIWKTLKPYKMMVHDDYMIWKSHKPCLMAAKLRWVQLTRHRWLCTGHDVAASPLRCCQWPKLPCNVGTVHAETDLIQSKHSQSMIHYSCASCLVFHVLSRAFSQDLQKNWHCI